MTANRNPVDRLPRRSIGGGLVLGLLAGAASPLSAQQPAMSVTEFLTKENAVRAAGVAADESPDLKAMRAELARATAAYRAELETQRDDGSPPHSCPPPKGQAGLTSTDVLRYFRALPADDRAMSVKDGFYAMMRARYPCEAPF